MKKPSTASAVAAAAAIPPTMAAMDDSLAFLSDMDDLVDDIHAVLDAADGLPAQSTLDINSLHVEDDPTQLFNDILSLENSDNISTAQLSTTSPCDSSGRSSPSTTSDTKEEPVKKSTTRSRQKAEMKYLRTQVVELEQELARLKSGNGESHSGSSVSFDDDAQASTSQCEVDAVWEKVAKRQYDQRREAELKNIKLRELLEGQLRLARSLEKLLRKRSPTDSDSLFSERKRLRVAPVDDMESQMEDIRLRIHQMFDRIDIVIQGAGLSTVASEIDDVQAKRDDEDNSIFMELVLARVLPFPLHAVSHAVWECLSHNRIELENGYYSATLTSDTVCEVQFSVKLHLRKTEALVRVRGVGSRRTEANRSMLVFENVGVADGSLFSGEQLSIREEGYIEMTGYPASAEKPTCTMIKSSVRLWPSMASDGKRDNHPQTGRFVDLVIGSYTQNMATIFQAIENSLLLWSA